MTCDLVKKNKTNKKISTLIYFSLWNPGNIFFFMKDIFLCGSQDFLLFCEWNIMGVKSVECLLFHVKTFLFPKKKKVLENVLSVLKKK